jgi:hypothetical protein
MPEAIAEWASRHPRIRRVWSSAPQLALELEPVGDSEETFAVWIAHAERWRAELRAQIDPAIELAWLDADGATAAPAEGRLLVYERGTP